MKTVWTIMRKEFARFFGDRRMLVSLFLPGILIYVIYSLLGTTLLPVLTKSDGHTPEVYVYDMPTEYEDYFLPLTAGEMLELKVLDETEVESAKEEAQKGDKDLVVVFPEDFSSSLASGGRPTVVYYYNSSVVSSSTAITLFESALAPVYTNFTLDKLTGDGVTDSEMTAMIFSSIAPMLLLVFLVTGCISIAPESIAGEKERGTLGAILVSPVKRSHVALGKLFSIAILSLLSGICSFLGIVLSLPNLLKGSGMELSATSYGFSSYAMILAIILSTVLVIVGIALLLSTYAKSVKEATSMVGPLTIVLMLCGLSTMLTGEGTGSIALYAIPLYNSARALYGIFSFTPSVLAVTVTVVANLIATGLVAFLLAKMFSSEKIIFQK